MISFVAVILTSICQPAFSVQISVLTRWTKCCFRRVLQGGVNRPVRFELVFIYHTISLMPGHSRICLMCQRLTGTPYYSIIAKLGRHTHIHLVPPTRSRFQRGVRRCWRLERIWPLHRIPAASGSEIDYLLIRCQSKLWNHITSLNSKKQLPSIWAKERDADSSFALLFLLGLLGLGFVPPLLEFSNF